MSNDQFLYKDNQNFNIDIEKLYEYYISKIDQYRSFVNIFDVKNKEIINKNIENTTSIIENINKYRSLIKIELLPQESRCHTFYRLIGLPVINKDKTQFYNPGYCPPDIKSPTGQDIIIKKSSKIKIASSMIDGFEKLSEYRETYYSNNFSNIFQKNLSIDASVLALSSYNIRKFSIPLEKTIDIFDTNINNQSYNIDIQNSNGAYFYDYVDSLGNKPKEIKNKSKRFHIIKPFIVDPRIDYSVTPSDKIICVPFLENKNQTIRDNVSLKRPFLEQVCIDRLNIYNAEDVEGFYINKIKEIVSSLPSIKDEQIIKSINDKKIYGISEQSNFLNYLNIIRNMMERLVDAQRATQKIESKYYWTPIPSKIGTENGCKFPKVNLNKNAINLQTVNDLEIIKFNSINEIQQLSSNVKEVSGEVDIGQFIFSDPSSSTAIKKIDSSNNLGNVVGKTLAQLESKRDSFLTIGSEALQTIEIIMGEFSGLGLCDIIAILASLYTIDKKYLIGFLDDDAFERMKSKYNFTERADIVSSITAFEASVKNYYNLMDKVYEDVRKNNTK